MISRGRRRRPLKITIPLSSNFILFFVLMTFVGGHFIYAAEYVGADTCQDCHSKQTKLWYQSDHFKAMLDANSDTVLGDFDNVTVNFHGIDSRFFKKDEKFFVETLDKTGKAKVFAIDYVFGHFPLQQYLVDIGDGHFQALNVAWDSRSKEEGGQGWYHLQPNENISPEHPFFWMGHFQNWNGHCADCHSTNLQKNYNPDSHSYNTTWSEINVACEACHGPASEHLELAKAGKVKPEHSGFSQAKPGAQQWRFDEKAAIAHPVGKADETFVDMCGGCHSRRSQIDEGGSYHQKYRLQSLSENVYFADGQIQDEVYVLGSFLQSKMYHSGVSCMNCHDPHSGKLLAEPNQVCAQCHQSTVYENQSHHLHPTSAKSVECVDCHMPERTYMGVDARRDHSFTIPRPDLSITLGVPNACVGCHEDKDNHWAAAQMDKTATNKSHWGEVNTAARSGDIAMARVISSAVNDETLPPLIRNTLAEQLVGFPADVLAETAYHALQNKDPLVRRGAVASLASADFQTRWRLLQPYFTDPVRSVRLEIALSMADMYRHLPGEYQKQLSPLLDEYGESLTLTQDFPSAQVALGNLSLNTGDLQAAIKSYQRALNIAPTHLPALLNLADLYRANQESGKELGLLKKAMKVAPDSAAVQHSMGLYYIRQSAYGTAMPYLREASGDLLDASPRYSYVYAVALDSQGNTAEAVNILKASDKRWPNQLDTLATLVMYLEKLGNADSIKTYIEQLKRIAPNSPQIKEWDQKYH